MTIDNHMKITLGLVISLLMAVASGAWWASDINTRLEAQERQTKSQWERLSKIEALSTQQAVMNSKIETILSILKEGK